MVLLFLLSKSSKKQKGRRICIYLIAYALFKLFDYGRNGNMSQNELNFLLKNSIHAVKGYRDELM